MYDIVNCGPRHRFWANGKLVHNSDGINMQNINRNTLVTNDTKFGTFVFYDKKADRVVNANQGGKVYLAKHGLVDNDEELLHQFGLRDSFLAPKGKTLVCFDLSQVECVSGDGLVLTDNGIKKICDIYHHDKVWDGVEYVKHDGVVFKGVKDVIEYNGIIGTPDHIVYKRDGTPISLDQAAFSKAELLTGGDEWEKIWREDVQEQNLHEMGVHNGVFKPESETTAPIQSDKAKRFTKLGNVIVGTIPVYDIINCGPRHRFCYNGSVVSNCRMNAWLWGEMWVLDALTSGKDIYKVTAAGTYQVPYDEVTKSQRFVGKSQVLGLGYGAGVNGLKVVMGKRSEEFTDDQLQSFVDSYRKNAPNIRNGWKSCTRALDAMMSGQEIYVDAQGVTYTQGHKIILPNGLGLTYRDIHIQQGVSFGSEYVFWGKDKVTKKPGWEKTFGGKIDENLCVDGDALVLVKRGDDYKWVTLRNVKLSDLVFDGVDFVSHDGLAYKGVKDCIAVDGVRMTLDHEVLTTSGWKQAKDITSLTELEQVEINLTKQPFYHAELNSVEVYDILNCGPRNRFVVLGNSGAFIVHNCQALCRIVLAEQMANIKQDFIDRGWSRDDAHICMQVHDEVITCCREDIADDVAKIMKQRMKESPRWCKTLPLDCDGDIARRYGCAK